MKIIIFLSIFLTACSVTPAPSKMVYVHVKEILSIPPVLLTHTESSVPPSVSTYINSSLVKKEELLTNFSVDLLYNLSECNNKIKTISDVQLEQNIIIKGQKDE